MNQLKLDYELTREEQLIDDIIQKRRGKESAILGPEIAQMTGIRYDDVRATISGLITHHGRLIGSCSKGYYLIIEPGEVDEVYQSLRRRGLSILYRASKIKKISIEEIFQQARLEMEEM